MKSYRYVTLDPTGNLTCLVLDPVDPGDQASLTSRLLKECEQVAYLEPPVKPEAAAGIRLMGGEFCGNASMAAAVWLAQDELAPGEEKSFLLEVSGAEEPVLCTVRKTPEGMEGSVDMPGIPIIREAAFCGRTFTEVRMEGIVHLVCEQDYPSQEEAEDLIRKIAEQLPDGAVGLLQWNSRTHYLLPLVYVRGSGSCVWEHGCGSGSAAVGALQAIRSGEKEKSIPIGQPGGTICVTVRSENGKVTSISISGQVRTGPVKTIMI